MKAHKTKSHQGVLNNKGIPVKTPHFMFVNDNVYADIYNVKKIEQTAVSGIKAILTILGESDLAKRQDPVSWDKFIKMIVHHKNKALSQCFLMRSMAVKPPDEYIQKVVKLLKEKWGLYQRMFLVKEAEMMGGQLTHIATTIPWLCHLMYHVYISISAGLKKNTLILVGTSKQFWQLIKRAYKAAVDKVDELKRYFAQAKAAKKYTNSNSYTL